MANQLPFDPSQLTSVSTVGSRPAVERPFGKKLRSLAQKGVLSVLLLLQLGQAGLANTHMGAPDLPSPGKETAALIQSAQDQAPAQAGVQFVNPIAEHHAQVVRDNGIDAFNVMQEWRNTDMEVATIASLSDLLVLTQSPTFTSNPDTLARSQALAERTAGIFEIANEAQAQEFLSQHSAKQLVEAGLLSRDRMAVTVGTIPATDMDQVFQTWEGFSRLAPSDEAAPLFTDFHDVQPTKAQLDAAIENISNAVAETGLNSLHIPLPMWTSPDRLNEVADLLINANNELKQVTSWDGPVLGLNGRVNLGLGLPYNVAAAGPDVDGTLSTQLDKEMIGHEHLHLVWQAMEQDPSMAPHVEQFRATIADRLAQAMPSWDARINQVVEHKHGSGDYLSSSEYMNNSHERVSYAFSGYLNAKLGEGSALYMPYAKDTWRPASVDEAASTEAIWNDMFATLGNNWWKPDMEKVAQHAPTKVSVGSFTVEVQSTSPSVLTDVQSSVADTVAPPKRSRISIEAFSPAQPSPPQPVHSGPGL